MHPMFQVILGQQISAVLDESRKPFDRDLILQSSDIAKMECIAGILQPFAIATKMLGTETLPSVSLVQRTLTALLKKSLRIL